MKFILIILLGVFNVFTGNANSFNDITIIKINSTGDLIAIGYDDAKVELWDISGVAKEKSKLIWTYNNIKASIADSKLGTISSINFSKKYQKVVIVYRGYGIHLIDIQSGKLTKNIKIDFGYEYRGNQDIIYESDYNDENGFMAVSGIFADRVLLMNMDKIIGLYQHNIDSCIIVSGSFTKYLIGGDSHSLNIPSIIYQGKKQASLGKDYIKEFFHDNYQSGISALKISKKADYLLAGTKSGKLLKWIIDTTEESNFAPANILSVASSSKSDFQDILGIDCTDDIIVSVSHFGKYGNMQCWAPSDMNLFSSKVADQSTCRRINLSKDGKFCITTGDFSYKLWVKNSEDYQLLCNLHYSRSVGYAFKHNSVDFYDDNHFAVADDYNVYFYSLKPLSFLFDLKYSGSGIKIQ